MSIFENTVLVDKKVSVVNVILRYLCIALAIFCVLVSIIVYPGIFLFAPASHADSFSLYLFFCD